MTEHEKCLTNGTYERARESGTEQNYDIVDGCVNNVPKKPRRIGGRWSGAGSAAYQAGRAETKGADPATAAGAKLEKLKIRYDAEWRFL